MNLLCSLAAESCIIDHERTTIYRERLRSSGRRRDVSLGAREGKSSRIEAPFVSLSGPFSWDSIRELSLKN